MKSLTTFVLFIYLLAQVPPVEASETDNVVIPQLTAVVEYLEHMLPTSSNELTADKLRNIVTDGADWIVAAQEESGHFGYEYHPFEGTYSSDEGMVRQAGTLFALSEVYQHQTKQNPTYAKTIEKAISYFENISGKSEKEDGDFWCIKNNGKSSRCDLGSVALALIGILNYVEAEPDKEAKYSEIIDKYSTYLISAKFKDRGFSNKYNLGDGFGKEESPFYNGESMLALVKYYEYSQDEKVKVILEETFDYLSAKEEYETPLYLWIMAALKDMNRLWPHEKYVKYAKDFTAWRIDLSLMKHSTNSNYCAPLEGMTSAYSILENNVNYELLSRLSSEINFWQNKTTYLQLNKNSPYRLMNLDGQLQLLKQTNPNLSHGGFLSAENIPLQRIDFTQHCVSSYLQKLVDINGETF